MMCEEAMSLEKDVAQLKLELAETRMQLLEAQAMLVAGMRGKAMEELAKLEQAEKETSCQQPSQ